MPNWKIEDKLWELINTEVARLMSLRVACVQQDFPVTKEQLAAAIIPPAMRGALQQLVQGGASALQRPRHFCAVVTGEGVERPALLSLNTPVSTPIFYYAQHNYSLDHNNPRRLPSDNYEQLPFDLDIFDEAGRAAVVKWVNLAVRENRLTDNTKALVKDFVANHCESLSHMDCRWPDLKIIFAGMTFNSTPWRDRVRNLPTRKRTRWGWPTEGAAYQFWVNNQRKMEAAAQVIVGAQLIDRSETVKPDPNQVIANVMAWGEPAGSPPN